MRRDGGSPQVALQFSSLYSRLITQPILSQKWSILYFLWQLSESNEIAIDQPAEIDPPTSKSAVQASTSKPQPGKEAESFEKIDENNGILRDLPFALQGISSSTFSFEGDKVNFSSQQPVSVTMGLLNAVAEPALLYRGLKAFLASPQEGLLHQSLCASLETELRSYLKVVSTLEGRIRQAAQSSDHAAVTLGKCVVWLREATLGLRLLSWITEESKTKKGGQIISLIHDLSSSYGDPMIKTNAERLLSPVTRPFYDMLRRWIYDGELSDPFHEFFVSERDPSSSKPSDDVRGRGAASNVWEDKYKLDHNMIPSITTEDFAQKVFLIGKSLNFIRYGCGDSIWVEQYSKDASKELRYGDTETLETWIDEAYKTTMARLIHLMSEKFQLFQHLKALKDYILLGQGDFIALLMESLSANLDRPAGAQYRHTLTAQLEHAIRGSNAQFDAPEVLRRLDARMLQLSHGDIGWDCFTLEYKIDAPVDVIVTDWGNRQYLKVFNFLWRIKRVEFVLSTTWRKCMTGARGVLQSKDSTILETWKTTRGTISEMIHFISQLQYYILFEVIESSWDELQAAIRKDNCTLDDIIKAHTKYLTAITHKGLLGASSSDSSSSSTFLSQLGDILATILSYRDTVDGLYSYSVAEYTRQQATQQSSIQSEDNTALNSRLKSLADAFRAKVGVLLGDLAHQPDPDMRFLGVVMNFNDHYVLTRRRTKHKTTASTATGGGASATVGAH